VGDALRSWVIPSATAGVIVICAAFSATGVARTPLMLAAAIFAALVLLLYIGEHPLLGADAPARDRALGAALGLVWLAALYVPFHARLFPGTPLVDAVEVTAAGRGLPLHIPAAGHPQLDLEIEGKLPHAPTGAALPVSYALTLEGTDQPPRMVTGRFDETLKQQRLGRRGSTIVHQAHQSEVHVLPNPERQDLTVTKVSLEPENAPPLTISAYAHPLPRPPVLAVAALALLAAVLTFDRRGPLAATDGALTLATTAVVGTAIVFWTSNAVHPDFQTLVGSVIFGGPLGFGAGALLWWIAKRVIGAPAH
jgi:hypothetical protein